MTRRPFFISLVIVLALGQAIVRSAVAEEMSSLLGTWTTEYTVQSRQGESAAEAKITITEQKGPLFRGTYEWEYDSKSEVIGDHSSGVGKKGKEPFLGVIGWDNKSINIADIGDKGFWFGELTGADTMRVVYVESQDHATVLRAQFVRERSGQKAQ